MSINGIRESLSAIRRHSAAMDSAAEKLVRSSSTNIAEAPKTARDADAIAAQEAGLLDGTVEMMVSRRMFTAAIKLAATANEGVLEALRLGGYEGSEAA